MSSSESAMLFLPPHPPVALREDAKLAIGRSRTCDLRLPSSDASRRHAEIEAKGGVYLLRDLDSTNGTFVNGEAVKERTLAPGDRIRIGGHTILFCHVDAGLEPPGSLGGEDQTVMVERPVSGESFQGDLAQIPPYAVLQILELGHKTGLLEFDADLGVGRLWLVDGSPVHAETKGQRGFDAALSIANATSGRFAFDPAGDPPERTITASMTQLLLEATRILDEEQA